MLKDLIKLANHLDQKGLKKEADHLDYIVKKATETDDIRAEMDNESIKSAARLYIGIHALDPGQLDQRHRIQRWLTDSFAIRWGNAELLIREIEGRATS